MTEIEKVLYALNCRAIDCPSTCAECSYYNAEWCCCNTKYIMKDALDLLDAQMPRVMTLAGICACKEGDCLYYQGKGSFDGNVLYISSDGWFYVDLRTATHRFTCDPSLYGSMWRCWTSRPSAEMMASTAWEGDAE